MYIIHKVGRNTCMPLSETVCLTDRKLDCHKRP